MSKENQQRTGNLWRGVRKTAAFAAIGATGLVACSRAESDYAQDARALACQIVEDGGAESFDTLQRSASITDPDTVNGHGQPTDETFTVFFPDDVVKVDPVSICEAIQDPSSEFAIVRSHLTDDNSGGHVRVIDVNGDKVDSIRSRAGMWDKPNPDQDMEALIDSYDKFKGSKG